MAIVQAAQEHVSTSSALQRSVFETQKELLGGVTAIVSSANRDVEKIGQVLVELKKENIADKLSSVQDELKKIEHARAKVETASQEVGEQPLRNAAALAPLREKFRCKRATFFA